MPRKPRMYLQGVPCHITSRGNDRQACFHNSKDYLFYLSCLEDACRQHEVLLHAYVLMTNHVHLLATPSSGTGISKIMQSVGRRYVRYFNHSYKRSGTLWEGRHKATLIDAEPYLLACYRYIELNPVRANMVKHPGEYPWSSYRVNAGLQAPRSLAEHQVYKSLGFNKDERHKAYRDLLQIELDQKLMRDIRRSVTFATPLGDKHFKRQVTLKAVDTAEVGDRFN